MDRKSRKTITMVEASHLRSGMDRLCVKKVTNVRSRGLMSVEFCNEDEENSSGFSNSEVNLIRGVNSSGKTQVKAIRINLGNGYPKLI